LEIDRLITQSARDVYSPRICAI